MRTGWLALGMMLACGGARGPGPVMDAGTDEPAPSEPRCTMCDGFVEETGEPPASTPDGAPAARPAPDRAPRARSVSGASIKGHVEVPGSGDAHSTAVARTVVYLGSDASLDGEPPRVDHVSICQKNKSFVPNFEVVSRTTTIEFPNWDEYDHNVFSRSKAAPAFDLDRYPKGMSKSRMFDKVGVVQVFCNIHPQMRAIILVTPNVYFTRVDAQGDFELAGVPPGHYRVVAWSERCEERQQEVDVTAAGAQGLSFKLEESRAAAMENAPPKRDADYGVERGLGVKREKLNLPVVPDVHPAVDPPPSSTPPPASPTATTPDAAPKPKPR
jgi:plastocyanin